MPIGVGVVGEGDVEAVAHADQTGHRIGRGAIHPDLAVPVSRHEAEGRIDRFVDHRRRDAVTLDHGMPVMHRRAAQRINADLHAC